jgi:hypothetical protein
MVKEAGAAATNCRIELKDGSMRTATVLVRLLQYDAVQLPLRDATAPLLNKLPRRK